VGTPNQPFPISHQLYDYIFDIFEIVPALLGAKFNGGLAPALGLRALDCGPTYFTGDSPISDPALTCFRVEDILPLGTLPLAKHLRLRGIGQLEIKQRGVDIVPEKLRRELKLRGDIAATLLLAKIAGRPAAILAHRVG
jgi:hypothetical protein